MQASPIKATGRAASLRTTILLCLSLPAAKASMQLALPGCSRIRTLSGSIIKGTGYGVALKQRWKKACNNVAFLRIQIESLLDYFAPGGIDEIWITFPDPQPQLSREKKRLTSPRFLEMYKVLLKPWRLCQPENRQ